MTETKSQKRRRRREAIKEKWKKRLDQKNMFGDKNKVDKNERYKPLSIKFLTRICLNCKKSFAVHSWNHIFCSPDCFKIFVEKHGKSAGHLMHEAIKPYTIKSRSNLIQK